MLQDILAVLPSNVIEIVGAILTVIGSASVIGKTIAPFTKTTKDDALFAKIEKAVLFLSLNVKKK
jgi:hypothetical protein